MMNTKLVQLDAQPARSVSATTETLLMFFLWHIEVLLFACGRVIVNGTRGVSDFCHGITKFICVRTFRGDGEFE